MKVIPQTYKDIVTPELLEGAIENNLHEGFLQDYHVLHCLIKIHKPKSFLEIGTHIGTGTNIICNADPKMDVYSLDLPNHRAGLSLQHPTKQSNPHEVGYLCKFPYTQLFGDSLNFNYDKYECEGYFVDGEHTERHAFIETCNILEISPKLIVWHDADMPEVYEGIEEAFIYKAFLYNYNIYRVTDTRILYAVKK